MSALPKAVRKQIEEADRILAELNKPAGDAPPQETPPEAPAPAAAAPEAPPQETPPPAPQDESTWEARYKVLQGKYNAEVPRLQSQVRDMGSQLGEMRQQLTMTQGLLASLGKPQESASSGASGTPAGRDYRYVKDEERRDFGDELLDVVGRRAQEVLLPEIDKRIEDIAKRLGQTDQKVGSVVQKVVEDDQQKMLNQLSDAVTNWKQINVDPAFLAWLDSPDPYSGHLRRVMLDDAYQRNDGPRVIAFFQGFLNENAAVTNQSGKAPGRQAPAGTRVQMEDLVAPGKPIAGAAGAPNEAEKRIWTQAQIAEFYADCAKGKYRNNPKKRDQLEMDIFMAQAEGRIRP